jgi:hypothetical protein
MRLKSHTVYDTNLNIRLKQSLNVSIPKHGFYLV